MDDEGIDKSEELTVAQVSSYVSHRIEHGELDVNNGMILVKFPTFVDRLAATTEDGGLGVINEDQRQSAVHITLLRDVAFNKLGAASMREYAAWIKGYTESVGNPETIFNRVMRALLQTNRYYPVIIAEVCFDPVPQTEFHRIQGNGGMVRQALDALGKEIAAQYGRLRKELQDEAGMTFDQVCKHRFETHKLRTSLFTKWP